MRRLGWSFLRTIFYYLKIAQNLAHGSGSTFNGMVGTNGYHPLWLLILTGLSLVTNQGHFILGAVVVIVTISALSTYFLSALLIEEAGGTPLFANIAACYVAIYALHVFYTGMEIILAVPMMLLLAVMLSRPKYWNRGVLQSAVLGLVASLAIMSRLDLMMLVVLLVGFSLINAEARRNFGANQLTGLAIGLLPVAAYLVLNHVKFGTWMPISGMAKELRFTYRPAMEPWKDVYGHNLNDWVALLPIQIALVSLPFVWRRLTATQRVIFPAFLLFQPVYVFVVSCVSDWRLWGWYRYPSRAALCVSFAVFCILPRTKRLLRSPLAAAAVMLAVLAQIATANWTSTTVAIYQAAEEIKNFETTHPGTYAMGDRSGMVGYLLSGPMVQTEGLVMDKTYLERVKRQQPLLDTLRDYKVRYYVAVSPKPVGACYEGIEPTQAGATSAHMKGELCSAPLAIYVHDGYSTMIFDLFRETRSRAGRGGAM